MKLPPAIPLLALLVAGCGAPPLTVAPARPDYPPTRTVDRVDRYHGEEIADPFRWLEESGEERDAWVAAQHELLVDYAESATDLDALAERIRAIGDHDRIGSPVRGGERYFHTYRARGARHPVLRIADGIAGEAREILDFASLIDDDALNASGFVPSRDGRRVVVTLLDGQGWGRLELVDVDSGRPRPDERIEGVAGNSAIWTHDDAGFFYMSYGELAALRDGAAPVARLLYHRIGTPSASDRVIFERPDRPQMLFAPKLGDGGRYLVLALNDGERSRNRVIYRDLAAAEPRWIPLIDEADAAYTFEGNVGRRLLFNTTLDAPRNRLIAVDLDRPGRSNWIELIPERETPLTAVSHIGGRLVVRSVEHALPVVQIFTLDGELERTLELPVIGSIGGFPDGPDDPVTTYTTGSLFDPLTIWRVDVSNGESTLHARPELSFDPDDYELRQVFYGSEDGTRIPMFLAHRKDVPLRGANPLFMYGFGHGGWVAFPWFQPHLVAWMDLGGVYALPGLRGGGEYGDEWRRAGTGVNKPTTISDYIAAAEWLIDRGYTRPELLVANGGSASGVVPAAAAIARPDLFGAAVIDFPFLDMLRYHEFTVMSGWTRGYGSSAVEEEYRVLRSYSPLHNVEPERCYPAFLTIVAEEDSATVPMHGYKFTAALQTERDCDGAALLQFIPGVGHYSYGKTPEERAHNHALIVAFLMRALALSPEP